MRVKTLMDGDLRAPSPAKRPQLSETVESLNLTNADGTLERTVATTALPEHRSRRKPRSQRRPGLAAGEPLPDHEPFRRVPGDPATGLTMFPAAEGERSFANGINNGGDVVGYLESTTGKTAFIWCIGRRADAADYSGTCGDDRNGHQRSRPSRWIREVISPGITRLQSV